MKEIRVKPLDEDNKNGKMIAYIFLFQPILCIIVAVFIIFMNIKTFEGSSIFFVALGIFILLAVFSFFKNISDIANGVLAEEVCYIENKIFCYTKTRNFLGIKKVIKSFQIPIAEISDVRENEKKIRMNMFSLFKPRNSVEIETREGKKYSIMNDFYLFGKNLQDNDTKVESREERAKRIFNEVKELIMSAKNENTFNF
ncbi:hypothetical protein HMPREF3051_03115 [Fusobacterium sp. HMSC064B11]|uniref:Uncharacterized protein n=1 Tax=Fusobacterium nucleatum subsp. polymorphum TaxID=76857 RepID=A0A2C6AY22_FUSNP|nr:MULTISPECIES: hypothetical protein [Fusobacterium]OFO30600.1 hypothetical protein HMPREF3051_03115 [Fusobacterium sp. HMSC064B11]PHH96840.1 hypothetical protein CA840_05610 [Fusobacterium polymorphum]